MIGLSGNISGAGYHRNDRNIMDEVASGRWNVNLMLLQTTQEITTAHLLFPNNIYTINLLDGLSIVVAGGAHLSAGCRSPVRLS